jgi:hypothetical protein
MNNLKERAMLEHINRVCFALAAVVSFCWLVGGATNAFNYLQFHGVQWFPTFGHFAEFILAWLLCPSAMLVWALLNIVHEHRIRRTRNTVVKAE